MDKWGDIYKSIGAKPIINAIGSVTLLGGSTPIKEVKEAMDEADSAYVPLMELQEKAGDHIAKLTNVPSAYITSGAGSALTKNVKNKSLALTRSNQIEIKNYKRK